MVQEHEKELARVKEEMRKFQEIENQKTKQLEEEKQTLEAAAKDSAEQLESLADEKVRVQSFSLLLCQFKLEQSYLFKIDINLLVFHVVLLLRICFLLICLVEATETL